MKDFAQLIHALDSTNKTLQKVSAIENFLDNAHEKDKLWFLALFTGKRPKRNISTTLLKKWVLEVTNLPEWLFIESYVSVGDLGETIALLLPPVEQSIDKYLFEWMEEIIDLADKTEEEKKDFVINGWANLGNTERFIFNKLLGGSFRLGVSSKTLINALAKYYQLEATAITHSIMGDWKVEDVEFESLIHGKYTTVSNSKPYPFCLAYALDKNFDELENIKNWQVEYKWDGIRSQIIKRENEVYIWSRGEELITHQFPEIVEAIEQLNGDFVIDGELIVVQNNEVANFSELQKRLNRKTITKKMLIDLPVSLYAYDLLEYNLEDFRINKLKVRRNKLEELLEKNNHPQLVLSPLVHVNNWQELVPIREDARSINSEGLMLKHLDSPYHSGRKRGDWWKWKIEPLTIDAVLIYAQKGSGRRSGHYTDYTFAIRNEENQLVTIAKAYSGLTDKEIQEVSRFVKKNALEKFGPVRTVKPELVFEIAFEGISYSKRHKSGVALRFPRIKRWRKDKTVDQIDHIDDVKRLIH